MRLPALSSAALAAVLLASMGSNLEAQGPPYPVRKVADIVDTLGTFGLAEPASGRFLVYANRRGIQIVDQRTGKTTASIDRTTAPVVGSQMSGSLSISASGRRLAFLASGEPNDNTAAFSLTPNVHVWSVDLDTVTGKPVSAPHRVSIMPAAGLGISDDGRWIAFVTFDSPGNGTPPKRKLVMMPSDGGDERILDTAPNIQTPRWSPDGKTIYYIRGRGRGPGLTRIAATGGEPDSLAPAISVIGVSTDGQRVAYYPYNGDNGMVVRVADPQGREIRTLLINAFPMAWSRHEPAALLARRGEWPTTLRTVSLDNGQVSSFPLGDRFASGPRFSPDGRRLAATSLVDDRAQIIVSDLGSNQRRVLRTAAEPLNWAPDGPSMQWSPDGRRIAFLALDSTLLRHDLYVVDVATSRSERLADLGPAKWSNGTLFRWRSDGQSIDYITGTGIGVSPSLERVTLTGKRSVITKLPAGTQGNATHGGYRLLNDTLIAIGRNPESATDSAYLAIVDARTGVSRSVIKTGAYWNLSDNSSVLSPDGKWVAFGTRGGEDEQTFSQWAVASLDGKTVRLLGEPTVTPCRKSNYFGAAWPHEWLPDSRSLIAVAASCDRVQVYAVPIDGTSARRLPDGYADVTLMPNGRSLLAATIRGGSMSIVALDLAKALGPGTPQTAEPTRKSGKK